ncbi:MAG: threonine synthase [Spirochaetales bacterium]|jgi:threonine synthase|nr:threonine synthase [Spirochaetales bacterium]
MKYASTRNPEIQVTFKEAVFRGLAPDGGLYHPVSVPDLRGLIESFSGSHSIAGIGAKLTAAFFGPEISEEAAEGICRRAFTFEPALVSLPGAGNIGILELFHGPSCAFKDFGASFLAAVMEEFLKQEASRAVILTATSGDTGSAVARAFHKRANINVVILYPSGRVSPLQEKQLTTLGDNISALEVKGSFDDCQRMVKEAFLDRDLNERLRLTSANSINLGRLIPQAFYYVYGWTRLSAADRKAGPVFCVPSGNFGNLTAGVLAWQWGLPARRFIAATNINKVVPEYLTGGAYSPRPSVQTLSNAMDVGDPSNFERLQAIFEKSRDKMSKLIEGVFITDRETRDTMHSVYAETGMFLDPHTALGVCAAKRYMASRQAKAAGLDGAPCISLSTAHPGKFIEVVEEATGKKPPLPQSLARVLDLRKESTVVESTGAELKKFLYEKFADQ